MYDFAIRGTIAGIYPTQDGNRMLMKIQPEKSPSNLERDERPGLLAVSVPQALIKNFGLNTIVLVRGKESVRMKEHRGNDGKVRSFPRYTHEAESVEVVKAA